MRAVLLLAVLAALCACVMAAECSSTKPTLESVYQSEFSGFVKRHVKKYTHDEFALRYSIFKANYNKIQERQLKHTTLAGTLTALHSHFRRRPLFTLSAAALRVPSPVMQSPRQPVTEHRLSCPVC
jgi:hypothetical protein